MERELPISTICLVMAKRAFDVGGEYDAPLTILSDLNKLYNRTLMQIIAQVDEEFPDGCEIQFWDYYGAKVFYCVRGYDYMEFLGAREDDYLQLLGAREPPAPAPAPAPAAAAAPTPAAPWVIPPHC